MSSLRSQWNEMPAARLLPALISGILLFEFISGKALAWCASGLLLLGAIWLLVMSYQRHIGFIYRMRFVAGAAVFTGILGLGYLLAFLHAEIFYGNHFSKHLAGPAVCEMVITDEPVLKESQVIFPVEVTCTALDTNWVETQGKALVRVERDSISEKLQYGDALVAKTVFKPFDPPANPGEFSYQQFQRRHGIYQRALLKAGMWQLLEPNHSNGFMTIVHRLRKTFLHILKTHVTTPNELGVTTAMLLGYREFMNAELMQAYSGSGALHVLSVSGLHVGIVFLTLQTFLSWLDKRRNGRIIKAVLIISLMWCYACLTGLCPSVLRAVMMFTMAVIAKARNRHTNSYNVLAASCLALLLYDPMLLFDVGFLLSYIAVFGIMYLHPLIYKKLMFRNYILDKGWSLIAVSVAAQIATAPLSIFYFHQFPTYFLLSNLLVIPASDAVLMLGMLLFALHWLPYLGMWCGRVFYQIVFWMDRLIFQLNTLPFALLENLFLTSAECVLLYLLIIAMVRYFQQPRKPLLWLGLVLLLVCSCSFSYRKLKTQKQELFCVYSIPGHSAPAYIRGDTAWVWFDSLLQQQPAIKRFHVLPHWQQIGVTTVLDGRTHLPAGGYGRTLPFGTIYCLNGKKIWMAEGRLPEGMDSLRLLADVDVVVISGNTKPDLGSMGKWFLIKEIVLDASVPLHLAAQWEQQAEFFHIALKNARSFAVVEDLNNDEISSL
ncbi:MAG: ComEC/Rec2 family competence protein [Chitinophagales bacterium]